MTNTLRDELARVIAKDNGRRDPDPIDKCNADAVIDHLAPMLDEVEGAFEKAKEELFWLKENAGKDPASLGRVVGFEDCLMRWMGTLTKLRATRGKGV